MNKAPTDTRKNNGKFKTFRHLLVLLGMLALARFILVPYLERFEILPGESRLQAVQLPEESGNARYAIGTLETDGISALEISGWGLIQGESADGQEVFLILKSADNTYVFDTATQRRPDVTKHFEEENLDYDLSGFRALLPLRLIKNQEYRLGLYVRKGGREALVYTGRLIVKLPGAVYLPEEAIMAEADLPEETGDIICEIERVDDIGSTFKLISGWAFVDGYGTEDNEIYLVLKSEKRTYVLETNAKTRNDVTLAGGEENLNLDHSGFEIFINVLRRGRGMIRSGDYRVGVYIRSGERESLAFTDTVLRKSGRTLEVAEGEKTPALSGF